MRRGNRRIAMIKSLRSETIDSIRDRDSRLRALRAVSPRVSRGGATIRISIFPRDTRQPGKLVTAFLLARIFFTGREKKKESGRKEKRIQRIQRMPRARKIGHRVSDVDVGGGAASIKAAHRRTIIADHPA